MDTPGESYRHTQIGYTMLILGFILIAVGLYGLFTMPVGGLIFIGGGLIQAVLFGCLTVVVRGKSLQIRLGIGLIHRRYDLSQFTNVQVVRNRWIYGLGVRWWPGNILYNVSGCDEVEIVRPDGSRVRIGTNEPEALAQALREAMEKKAL